MSAVRVISSLVCGENPKNRSYRRDTGITNFSAVCVSDTWSPEMLACLRQANTGDAFDVKVASAVTKREQINSDEWERSARYRITDSRDGTRVVTIDRTLTYYRTTMVYTLTNARPSPVTVDLESVFLELTGTTPVDGQHRQVDEAVQVRKVPS